MAKRLFVKEEYTVKNNEVDEFIETKENNGFTIIDISIRNEKEKIIVIEKWNK